MALAALLPGEAERARETAELTMATGASGGLSSAMGGIPADDGPPADDRLGPSGAAARRIGFRAAAVVFALIWLVFCFGLIDLSYVAFIAEPSSNGGASDVSREVGVLEVAYGAVATFMVSGAFLTQVWAPRGWPMAVQQIAALTLAFGLAGALGLDMLSFISVAMLILMQAILLGIYPARRPRLLPRTGSVNRPLLLTAAIGAVPWLSYAWHMSANSRAHLVPEEQALRPQAGGWAGAAVFSFAVLLLAVLSSTRAPGWRLPLWTTAVAVLTFAGMSVRYPTFPGSAGRGWGTLAVVWVIALLMSAEAVSWGDRRPRERPSS